MARMEPCVVYEKRLARDAATCPNCGMKDPFYEKRNKIIIAVIAAVAVIGYLALERF